MIDQEDYEQIEAELARAEAARLDGFEGRARVCARRAAGIAIRAYTQAHQIDVPQASAYDLLVALEQMPGIPDEARHAARLLTERVDVDYTLPLDVDLITECRRLVTALASDTLPGDKQR
jgi:hypothetical protein